MMLVGLLACGKTADPSARACAESVAVYCASSPCVMHIDPTDIVASYCGANSAYKGFGVWGCGDGGEQIQTDITFQYDTTGQLVAVLTGLPFSPACVAGPSTFDLPSKCVSDLVAFTCGNAVDAGVD